MLVQDRRALDASAPISKHCNTVDKAGILSEDKELSAGENFNVLHSVMLALCFTQWRRLWLH